MTAVVALRRPGIGRLGAAGLLSEVGDWVLFIALPLFVLQLSGSAFVTATVFALEVVPTVLAGPFVGVLIDRYDPWRLMTTVATLQALSLLPLLAVTSADQLWLVYVVVAVESVLGAIIEPCRAATAAALSSGPELVSVNQVLGAMSSLARLVGGPLGGLALGLGGIDAVLLLDLCTFIGAGVLLGTGVRPRRIRVEEQDRTGTPTSYKEGVSIVVRTPLLRRIMGVAACMALAQGAFLVLFLLFVVHKLDGSEADVGVLRGVQAVGALAGAAALGPVMRRLHAARLVALSLFGFGMLSLIIWNAPSVTRAFGLYVGLFIAVGLPGLFALTGLITLLQTHAQPASRGRVLSAFFAVSAACQAVGMLVAGLVGTDTGLTAALQVQGIFYLLAGVLALRLYSVAWD